MTHHRPSEAAERISEAAIPVLRNALRQTGVALDLGAFKVRIRSALGELPELLRLAYPFAVLGEDDAFVDARIDVLRAPGLRSRLKRLARIEIDGVDPFGPFPRSLLLPNFEWGLNWAFAHMMNAHLLLHSGTVEVQGKGVLLIAKPGSGKSTLTAGLVGRGARLLSDEFGVLRTGDGRLLPFPKPIALKNDAIEVVRAWSPEARIGPTFPKTRKGDLAHQAAPENSFVRIDEPVDPYVVFFPQYRHGSEPSLVPVPPAQSFMELASNSFNYELLGAQGFEAIARIVERCACYRLTYGNMQDAVERVMALCEESASPTEPIAA